MKLPNFGQIVGVDLIWVGGNGDCGRFFWSDVQEQTIYLLFVLSAL
jgi:hypothetical protein